MQENPQKTSGLMGLMPLALAMSGLFVAAAAQAEGVELHGYARTQGGGTSEGGEQGSGQTCCGKARSQGRDEPRSDGGAEHASTVRSALAKRPRARTD